jgi:hypothetical protein
MRQYPDKLNAGLGISSAVLADFLRSVIVFFSDA